VPEILLGGNHAKIREWQQGIARFTTFMKRPDLQPFADLQPKEKSRLWKLWSELSNADKKSLGLGRLSESSLREILMGSS
jgi:hypothetical protein